MDNPTTLIVAIMYVTIISTGLCNLLMKLSELAGGHCAKPDRLHFNWLLILLFAYLGYFWQTTELLEIEDWVFLSFVGFLIGPVVLLFGTNLLLAFPEEGESAQDHYVDTTNRFFLLLSIFYFWQVGIDFYFDSISQVTVSAGALAIFCIALSISDSYRFHKIGAVLGWFLVAASLGIRTM